MQDDTDITPVEDDKPEPEITPEPAHEQARLDGDDDAEQVSDNPHSYEADMEDTQGLEDHPQTETPAA